MQEITLPNTFFNSDYKEPKNKDIIDSLSHIIEDERGISEKAFSKLDEIMEESKTIINKYEALVDECRNKNQRRQFIAEQIYDKEFNGKSEEIKEIKEDEPKQ